MSAALVFTALGLGLRHGIDWDHIAAIADLSGSTKSRRRGFFLSMTYAIGHGAVVFALGTLAIAFGLAIPEGLDVWMGRLVGLTLIALGGWILVELARRGRDFRLQSRWMLVINGTFAGLRRVREGFGGRKIAVEHDHDHLHEDETLGHSAAPAHDHAHIETSRDSDLEVAVPETVAAGSGPVPAWKAMWDRVQNTGAHRHSHPHTHELALPDQATASYGHRTATGIGMLHGVGIESPTQIAIFVASSSVAGVGFGLILLGAWVIGLIVANAGLALVASAGYLNAERSYPVYAALAIVLGVLSIALGTLYVLGLDVLPAIS